jgi:RNA polymerase primary sigma factor
MKPDGPSDRWYERIVRRAPTLGAEEARALTAALEAHRVAVADEVLGSSIGLAYLGEIGAKLTTGALDVRNVIEMEADVRVADARAQCLEQLARIARLAERASRQARAPRSRTDLVTAIRDLPLRRPHVDAVIARMEAIRAQTRDALVRVRAAAEAAAHARTRLVESHLRLVVSIARRYAGQGLDLPDLVQEGTIGLMRAIDRFDARREVSFSTYAAWWVRQTMGRGLAKRARPVRLPLSVEEGLSKLRKHRKEVVRRSGKAPTSDEIASVARLSVERVDELRRIEHDLCQDTIPFDDVLPDDPRGRSCAEVLADRSRPGPEDAAIARRLEAHAQLALRGLASRERRVLQLRYGFDPRGEHTLEDIGRKFGLTRQRILQIASKALAKLRASGQSCPLRTFWES